MRPSGPWAEDDYLSRCSPYYSDFTKRLSIVSLNDLLDDVLTLPNGDEVDFQRFDGDYVFMTVCRSLRYIYSSNQAKAITHVSSTGADVLPYFLYLKPEVEDEEKEMINIM